MKILLFNLGTIEHRIIAWGIDGFKSLFEQDVILWGPIPDATFKFNDKEIPILRLFEQSSVRNLFDALPGGWYPDIVVCDTSVLNYIPDIYKCPVKTVLFARDSWSDTVFNRGLVELFDFVNSSTIDRTLYRNFRVSLLPLSGFAVSTPGPDSSNSVFEKRDIDALAIANYDSSFYHERYKTFYQLSDLNRGGLRIKYLRRIKRSEIYNYYQRSKIVVDWAHTLSNRSYEAALNGCLLFSHEDNKVMNEFWVPWEEYIPYNEGNISDLVVYYINNPDIAKKVIDKAQKRIGTIAVNWGQMAWNKISTAYNTEISVSERIKYNESTPVATLHYRSATPLLYNYDYRTKFPANWADLYFNRIDLAISTADNSDRRIPPLIEAFRVAFLLKKPELATGYLNELQKVLPDYAWIYYFFGRIYFEQGDYDRALLSLQQAIESGSKAPGLLQLYVLPVIEKGNTCDARRITSFMWQSAGNHNNEFQIKAFLHLTHELAGDIYQRKANPKEATYSYTEALKYLSVPDCIYKLAPLLLRSGDYNKLAEISAKGSSDSPYDSIIVFYHSYALIQLGLRKKASQTLRNHQKALVSFVGIRLIAIIRMSIYIFRPIIFVNRRVVSGIILEVIKILKRKAGVPDIV